MITIMLKTSMKKKKEKKAFGLKDRFPIWGICCKFKK